MCSGVDSIGAGGRSIPSQGGAMVCGGQLDPTARGIIVHFFGQLEFILICYVYKILDSLILVLFSTIIFLHSFECTE